MVQALIANDGVQYGRGAQESLIFLSPSGRTNLYCRNVSTGACRHTELETHANTLWFAGWTCWIGRTLFHYLFRPRQGELPPAKWSLPNRMRPQARTQCTLGSADSIKEVCDQGNEEEIREKNKEYLGVCGTLENKTNKKNPQKSLVTASVSLCCSMCFHNLRAQSQITQFWLELDVEKDYHKDAVEHRPVVFLH